MVNKFCKIIILSFLFLLVFSPISIKAQNSFGKNNERPNILWLVSEDNSPLLGCYGDTNAQTPVLDLLASKGILYQNAYSNAPVCAPSRSTIITGMYANSLGTSNMRSKNPIPKEIKFFTQYLRKAGYYCTNNAKEDYNTKMPEDAWDESSNKASWENRKKGQPFFSVINFNITHESKLHKSDSVTICDPQKIILPPEHPDTKEFRHDYAQYYDRIATLDSQIGKVLETLSEQGLTENTIIFYYGDHGGVLPGSKRFINEKGTRVPMIIKAPKKFEHLISVEQSIELERLISFVDLAPTVLSLCGIQVPKYMQGEAFLGKQSKEPRNYIYMFRDRMDERYDFVRAVRDNRFRYVRNFMPFLPSGQHIEYLWRMPAMKAWYELYKKDELNEIQKRFFEPREYEELYDLENDPYETNNLANDSNYKDVIKRMRKANEDWMIEINDVGFYPEPELTSIGKTNTPFDSLRDNKNYNVRKLLDVLVVVNSSKDSNIEKLRKLITDENFLIRYWGAVGCLSLGKDATPLINNLKLLLNDESQSVRIISAEVLFKLGKKENSINVLKTALTNDNRAVRLVAVNSIERLGEGAKLFKNELTEKLDDPYMDVKKVARWILRIK